MAQKKPKFAKIGADRTNFGSNVVASLALHTLNREVKVKAGKVCALGASAMYAYQFHNMQLAAEKEGLTPFSAMENHYNLLYREDERELIPVCRQYGVSLMPYSPLAAGHLARPTGQSDSLRGRTDRVAMGKIGWKWRIRRSSPRSKPSRSGTESRWRRRRLPGIGRRALPLRFSVQRKKRISTKP